MSEFFTLRLLIEIICASIASIAFSIVLRVNKRHLPQAGILSAATYFIYYAVLYFGKAAFLAAFLSTAIAALISEILARTRRTPTIVFLLPAVIPTVPGGSLYYAMRDLLSRSMQSAIGNFMLALEIGLGIAGGIVSVSITFSIVYKSLKKYENKTQFKLKNSYQSQNVGNKK